MQELIANKNHQRQVLRTLYLIRDLEEAIAARYPEGKMRCPTHLSVGQEGTPAALSPLLTVKDYAVSTHRAHAHYLAKGGDPKKLLAEVYGRATGCSGGRGGSMHLIDESVGFKGSTAIVGNAIPIGVGLALSQQLRKQLNITVIYVGDGAIEEGVFYESVNFSAVRNLPVLFICENNLYSVYSDLACRQPAYREIYEMVESMGPACFTADGNDVVLSYSVLAEAVGYVRKGIGPCFVELSTYRWREHCGPNYDNHIGYRTEDEFLDWQQKEPIKRYENWLTINGLMSETELTHIRTDIAREIVEAFEFAEDSPYPDPSTLTLHIYREGK